METNLGSELVISPEKKLFINFKEIWNYKRLLYIFAWRDIKVRYKQTVIGATWAIIQPVVTVIIFTLLFNKVAKISSGDTPYLIFSYTGLLFWNLFSNSLNNASNSLLNNQSMITKIYFPRIILPASAAVVSMVDFLLASLMLVGMMVYFRIAPTLLGISMIIPMLVITLSTSLGVGMFFGALNVKYRDVKHLMPFMTQILLFLTPVIYPVSLVPEKFQWILYLNPMAAVVSVMRAGLINEGAINWQLVGLSTAMSVVALIIGVLFFKSKEREFADVI